MMRNSLIGKGVMVLAMVLGVVSAGYSADATDVMKKIDFFGSAAIQAGQYVNFKYGTDGKELSNKWMQGNILTLGLQSHLNPRLSGDVSIKSYLYYNPFPDSLMNNPTQDRNAAAVRFDLLSAQASLNLSPDPKDSLLNVAIGIFPYKYNNDARNLGEYLFRTGCYPGFIYSYDGFDMTGAPLSGIRVSNNLFGSWHNELFLTSELYLYPSMDFSLTYLTNFTPFSNKVLNIGGAIQFYRLFPVDNAVTQPKFYQQMTVADGKDAPNWYVKSNGDIAYYTFAGTKLMGRFEFDPKPLIGGLSILSPEDLKLYSEAIILGVKDYPASTDSNQFTNQKPINQFGYNKLMEKMPIMLGLNLPAFKILDVLSLEVEYYGKKYVNRVPLFANSDRMLRLPLPYDPNLNSGQPDGSNEGGLYGKSGLYTKSTYYGGAAQWKWSVYAKKTLFNNFNITAQLARDHSFIQTPLTQNIDYEEIFIKDKQWYWMLKFGYLF
jgi:hypothetical protein